MPHNLRICQVFCNARSSCAARARARNCSPGMMRFVVHDCSQLQAISLCPQLVSWTISPHTPRPTMEHLVAPRLHQTGRHTQYSFEEFPIKDVNLCEDATMRKTQARLPASRLGCLDRVAVGSQVSTQAPRRGRVGVDCPLHEINFDPFNYVEIPVEHGV